MCVASAPFKIDMSNHGCEHVLKFKESKGTDPFRIIHSYFIACTSPEARKRKVGLQKSTPKSSCHPVAKDAGFGKLPFIKT